MPSYNGGGGAQVGAEYRAERSEMFRRIREQYQDKAQEEEEAEPFTVLESGIPLTESDLSATQKDILNQARMCGFSTRVYGARILFAPVYQKTTTEKTEAGTMTSPEKEVLAVFIDAKFPASVLAFRAGWADRALKFNSSVSDPVGQYLEITCGDKFRQVQWSIRGSKLFQAWLDQWRLMLTGVNKAAEKATELEEKAMRASLREMKKEMADD